MTLPERWEVSCVLPVYNEVASVSDTVGDCLAALRRLTGAFEIIAVDDGSTDGTARVLDRLAAAEPLVQVVHLPRNVGYGAALRCGFDRATLPVVFFTDSDGQFDPGDLASLLQHAGRADLVVGYRIGRREGALRQGLSAGFNAAVRALLPVRVRDVNCAFKLIHRRVLERVHLEASGYVLNAELLAQAAAQGFSVAEVGVPHRARRAGDSKVRMSDVPRSLRELLALRRRLSRGP